MVDKALDELLARKNSELIAGQSDSIGDSKLEAYKGLKDSLEEGLVAASRGTTVPSVAPRPAVTPPSQKQRPRSQMSMNNEDNKSEGQLFPPQRQQQHSLQSTPPQNGSANGAGLSGPFVPTDALAGTGNVKRKSSAGDVAVHTKTHNDARQTTCIIS